MDKNTLSNYGWIVIAVLVLSVMIALATPFGEYIKAGVESTTAGLFDTSEKALNVVGMSAAPKEESKINTVSGGIIRIDDVSKNSHNPSIKLSSDTIIDFSSVNVIRTGKNLLNASNFNVGNACNISQINVDSNSLVFTKTSDASASYLYADFYLPLGTYTFSGTINNSVNSTVSIAAYKGKGIEKIGSNESNNESFSFVLPESGICRIMITGNYGDAVDTKYTVSNIQLEYGSAKTTFEPYSAQTVTANTDGTVTGITSISPTMTIFTDADTTITCEYQKKKITTDLDGITILNFGDSIFGNARPPQDVSTFIAQETSATVYNVAFSGCRMGVHSGEWDNFAMYRLADAISNDNWTLQDDAISSASWTNKPAYFGDTLETLKTIDFNSVDIITIAYGTNDFTGSIPLDNNYDKYDTSTFAGALRHSIEAIQTTYPEIDIILCTPIYRFWMDSNGEFLYDSNEYKKNGCKLTDFAQKMKDVANEYGLTIIDNYYGCGIDSSNRTECFPSNDGTHPNETGRKLIANYISKELVAFYNK